jgi:hypothetical protein
VGNHLSARGNDLSVWGNNLPVRGNSLSVRGSNLFKVKEALKVNCIVNVLNY